MKSRLVSLFLAVLASISVGTILTQVSKNEEVQNKHCASLENPSLLENMKPIIRRDCIGELDRQAFGPMLLFLLPFFSLIFLVFDHEYTKLEKKLEDQK